MVEFDVCNPKLLLPFHGMEKLLFEGLNFLSFDRTVMSILLENGMDTEAICCWPCRGLRMMLRVLLYVFHQAPTELRML